MCTQVNYLLKYSLKYFNTKETLKIVNDLRKI